MVETLAGILICVVIGILIWEAVEEVLDLVADTVLGSLILCVAVYLALFGVTTWVCLVVARAVLG